MERKPSTGLSTERSPVAHRSIREATHGAHAGGATELVRIADALFDLAASERECATQSSAVTGLDLAGVRPSAERLLGIVAACAIPGCDVHFVTENGRIVNHVGENDSLPPAFGPARALLLAAETDVVAVAVFETNLQFLCLDGSLRAVR